MALVQPQAVRISFSGSHVHQTSKRNNQRKCFNRSSIFTWASLVGCLAALTDLLNFTRPLAHSSPLGVGLTVLQIGDHGDAFFELHVHQLHHRRGKAACPWRRMEEEEPVDNGPGTLAAIKKQLVDKFKYWHAIFNVLQLKNHWLTIG